MDADHFDSLARSLTVAGSRRRALVATLGGMLGVLLGTSPVWETEAKKKNKRKKKSCPQCKKRKKGKCKPKANGTACSGGGTCQRGSCQAPFCAGKNACEDGSVPSTCQRAGSAQQCACFATADNGTPFCGLNSGGSIVDCLTTPCPAGQTCIDFTGGECDGGTACVSPCPEPI